MENWELSLIDKNMMYRVLSLPTFSGREQMVRQYLLEYSADKGFKVSLDEKGNVYIVKGILPEGCYYPCVTAHMDSVHHKHIPFIEQNLSIPLITDEEDGRHIIYANGFGLGGDDKAGIVIALTVMGHLNECKAVFFVEEEIGCNGSESVDLRWFRDVGYIISFDSPGVNCASWSCNGARLFDREFYENYLKELDEIFGPINYAAHPYTDVWVLRMDTSLACMNIGAGYYEYHTINEYVVAEEMDKAAAIGLHLINLLGLCEHVIPYTSRYEVDEDPDYDYFTELFK